MKDITIAHEPIELHKLLKFESLVASGGEAKHVIDAGLVEVNGVVETRRRKKIVFGDVVKYNQQCIRIMSA